MLFSLLLAGCPKVEPEPAVEAAAVVEEASVFEPIVMPVRGSQIVYLNATFRAGSAHDPEGKEGLAFVTSQVVSGGGAGPLVPDEVQTQLFALGADIEVVVDKDLVTFRGKALREDMPAFLPIFTQMLTAPGMDESTFYRAVDSARSELKAGILESDEALGDAVFDSVINVGHPYEHPVQGLTSGLDAITLEDVQSFHHAGYDRAGVTFGLAGAVDDILVNDFLKAMEDLPEGTLEEPVPASRTVFTERTLHIIERGTASTGVHFGHPLDVDRGHPDYPALLVATTAFGAHRESYGRLFREMRGDRGLNYGDYAYIEHYREVGLRDPEQLIGTLREQPQFTVWVRPTETQDGPFALKMAMVMTEQLVELGLEQEEFEVIRTHLMKRKKLWAKDPGRRLGYAVEAEALGVPNILEDLDHSLQELTVEQVNAALKAHIHPEQFQVVVVSGDGAKFATTILKTYDTPMVYKTSAPNSEQAEEDKAYGTYEFKPSTWSVLEAEKLFE
ncbi:MAG: insulinase family protein [Proteobacteria bacterium]|nr:insulinase family protein [Pseudomonadota bacterium]MCP4918138.1 insulinase family protein [Pseudomonadota bacterium]